MSYHLRLWTAADETWLEQLRREAHRDVFLRTFGAWDEALHLRQHAECLARGNIHVIERHGQRVGMIQRQAAPGAVLIEEVQLVASERGQGFGSQLLGDVVADAHRSGRSVRLRVAFKNEHALRLYLRLGFQIASRSETHHLLELPPR